MKLQIAIPALNEEESIESIIRRSLDARSYICNNSPISEVGITVVSDGSTDRTAEIASWYRDQIDLIVFPENKGYGAAIKTGILWILQNAQPEDVVIRRIDNDCDFARLTTTGRVDLFAREIHC